METILEASIWGQKIGVLAWDKSAELGLFEFYDSFLSTGLDLAPLTMPLEAIRGGDRIFSFPAHRGKTFKGLPGMLADALPDDYGNTIINEYFTSQGHSSVEITPVDRLCYIGKRAMGALEFKPARHEQFLNSSTLIEMDHLTALAGEVMNKRENFQASLIRGGQAVRDILKVGTSAGGAKAKAVIAWDETSNRVRSGQVKAPASFSYWLLKFDGVEDKKLSDNPLGIGRIEYAYYLMALDCGISMSECRILPDGKYAHFMTKRFDRTNAGEKLHVQTLCAMAHFDRDAAYSYEQAFQVLRRLHLPENAMDQLFLRMVFNVVARNQDDHTKNHAFLMDQGKQWNLAPAYDLCFAYSASGKWTNKHQLSLNNKRDKFNHEDLMAVSQKMGIRFADEKIDQVIDVVSNWRMYALKADVRKEHVHQISKALRLVR